MKMLQSLIYYKFAAQTVKIFTVVTFTLSSLLLNAQTDSTFQGSGDIGNVINKGSVAFDKQLKTYLIKGSGKNMWYRSDEFFFVWCKVKGNFDLKSSIEWIGTGIEPHRKAGLIIRETFEPGSKYISIANHGDGLMAMQYRANNDSLTQEIRTDLKALTSLELEKIGNKITAKGAANGATLNEIGTLEMNFGSEFYVGLFVCSHNANVIESAIFSNTTLILGK